MNDSKTDYTNLHVHANSFFAYDRSSLSAKDYDSCVGFSNINESILNSPSDCDSCAFSDTSSILTTSIQHDYSIYSSSLVSNDACNAFNLGLSGKGMYIGHLNVQGLSIKIDQIKLMLTSKANSIHIFGMSESKLKDHHYENVFCIDGYQKPIRKGRLEGGGGINVYIEAG